MIDEAVTQAKAADVVVACVGESTDMNGEGASRSDITIPDAQKILLRALKATGKPIVIVLTTGRPLVLTEEDKNFPAILCTWNLGDQEGYSVADVLFGKVNPSGHLTMSFPRSVGQLPLYYNHKNTGRPLGDYEPYRKFTSCYIDVLNSPLYPFGYGMSYTTFKLSSISLSDKNMSIKNGKVIASINVTNTGSREGKETIQLYIHAKESSSTRPVKELRGFKKIDLKAGESKAVNFTLTPDDLKYYNHDLKYVCEPGCYDIMIGDNSRDVQSIVLNVK
jgi:beta-glucosidase